MPDASPICLHPHLNEPYLGAGATGLHLQEGEAYQSNATCTDGGRDTWRFSSYSYLLKRANLEAGAVCVSTNDREPIARFVATTNGKRNDSWEVVDDKILKQKQSKTQMYLQVQWRQNTPYYKDFIYTHVCACGKYCTYIHVHGVAYFPWWFNFPAFLAIELREPSCKQSLLALGNHCSKAKQCTLHLLAPPQHIARTFLIVSCFGQCVGANFGETRQWSEHISESTNSGLS